MKIVVAGGTGFIGRRLVLEMVAAGHSIVVLTRNPEASKPLFPAAVLLERWDGKTAAGWGGHVDGADAVINFAGEPIAAKRWSSGQKERIVASRINAAQAVAEAIGRSTRRPALLLNASAVGYYGDVPDGDVPEEREPGSGFLSETCVRWESAAMEMKKLGVRVVILRMGIVLGEDGGVLSKLLLSFRLFAGGPLGSGRQWFPWVHRDDVIRAALHLLTHPEASGPFNISAPEPVTMREFCSALGIVLHRPSFARVPASVLRLLLGEMSIVVLGGQRVIPRRLLECGFTFKFPTLLPALRSILA